MKIPAKINNYDKKTPKRNKEIYKTIFSFWQMNFQKLFKIFCKIAAMESNRYF